MIGGQVRVGSVEMRHSAIERRCSAGAAARRGCWPGEDDELLRSSDSTQERRGDRGRR